MTILEMTDKRSLLLAENTVVLDKAKTETRKMSDEEQTKFDTNITAVKDIDKKILAAQEELRKEEGKEEVKTPKMKVMNKEFNLLTAIRNRAEGRAQDAASLEVIDAGRAEMRKAGVNPEGDIILPTELRADILAGTSTQGQEAVAEDKLGIMKPLREMLVMVKAGATYLTGLTGDLSLPAYAGTSALWKGEVAASTDGAGAFSEVNFAPKRLTAHIDISKQFLAQDSVSAEAMLKEDIILAIASKLESTILGKANVSATQPLGLFYGAISNADAANFADMVAMETSVDSSNALIDNLAYITNAGGRGILKTTDIGTDTGKMLLDNNVMNGYPVHVTNHVAKELQTGTDEFGVIYANWKDFVIAQWGGVDLIVDPYTVATEGQVRIVVNAYFDAKFKRSVSYSVASIK